MTKTEAIINSLTRKGYKETTHHERTKKYRVFRFSGEKNNLYVGKRAALRVGRTIASSIPVNPVTVANLVNGGSKPTPA